MQIIGTWNTDIANYVLSGFYSINSNQGIKPKLYQFSSPAYPISNFQPPYDAVYRLDTGDGEQILAVGAKVDPSNPQISSDRSGVLYSYDESSLYGICHGFGQDDETYYFGYNFYNAFYPAGYYSPPYGENISIYNAVPANQPEGPTQALSMGVCAPLNITEYNETFGIVSVVDSEIADVNNQLNAGSFSQIYSPAEACPSDINTAGYFDEVDYSLIQGTPTQLGSTTFYNGNPIPTSLDSFDIRIDGRYQLSGYLPPGQTLTEYWVLFDSAGRPKASYSMNNQENVLNNLLCMAEIMESSLSAGTNGVQLLQAPDLLLGGFGDQTSFAGDDPFNMWNWQFEENSDGFPFQNQYVSVSEVEANNTLGSDGTALFQANLSSPDSYWQNRQCPATVDFLPWTFGASVYACPSYHFDIPYYAATKKFGFYGVRFLNSCSALNLTYPMSGVPNAQELPQQTAPYPVGTVFEPQDIDRYGSQIMTGLGTQYANLLAVANAEESYSNMYALNKGFFIWANTQYIEQSSAYTQLTGQFQGFSGLFQSLLNPFIEIYGTGISGFTGSPPPIILTGGTNGISVTDNSLYSDILFTTQAYDLFLKQLTSVVSGQGLGLWAEIENQFAYYVTSGDGSVNETFYQTVISGRQQRMRTRYMENLLRGQPIDLYPMNTIPFAFDSAQDFLESTGWSRTPNGFGLHDGLPAINRRYFQGAYGNGGALTGLLQTLAALDFDDTTAYYPGFFNDLSINSDTAGVSYAPVISGAIVDTMGRRYSPSGWLALGYNEVGVLNSNFSCFTPIFVQSPLPEVYCKVGQAPTLRSLAVDYHSIPEDKISVRYPEVMYWAQQLKLVDGEFNNLYPIGYQWYRIPITGYTGFLASGDFTLADAANPTGDWCCQEGTGTANCTVIHPLECWPQYGQGAQVFTKGAKLGVGSDLGDDDYFYFCVASGRFGIRMSQPSQIVIEDFLSFDVSFKNAMNLPNQLGIQFQLTDTGNNTKIVSFSSTVSSPSYAGYMYDPYAIPESVVLQKVPPPNAGYGDVTAMQFVGPALYIGATRSYTPSTVQDTRGLQEEWGRLLDYGQLVNFSKTLSQLEGDLLYGYSHLPVCNNYSMGPGQAGIKVIPTVGGNQITHWTLPQHAVACYDDTFGLPWNQLENFAALYPPIYSPGQDYVSVSVGNWQWGNNLGSIKRFGYDSTIQSQDIVFFGAGAPGGTSAITQAIADIKKKWIKPDNLAGVNCGYHPLGLGRNMIYYIEAFSSFYSYCDPKGKNNIQDLTYMNPGIRQTNSAIQYFWMGHPHNVYVERRPMYGPYAYQWRVRRGNRDRNGNGISEGFYSMAYDEPYSLIYDAPAVYGLYARISTNSFYIQQVNAINALRQKLFGDINIAEVRGVWFGTTNGEGSASNYGNPTLCGVAGADQTTCNYFQTSIEFANEPNFKDYACTQSMLNNGQCFDPCMSIRYSSGFVPGGRNQNLFGNGTANTSTNLVPIANFQNGGQIVGDEQSTVNKNILFRSPINTPYVRYWRGLNQNLPNKTNKRAVPGMSPCQDGGSDHCNYLTPTIHLGTSSFMQGLATAFMAQVNSIESLIGN